MGLDTHADVDTDSEAAVNEFISKCREWLEKKKLSIEDVGVQPGRGFEYLTGVDWWSCHSRILHRILMEVDGMSCPSVLGAGSHSGTNVDLFRNMNPSETAACGNAALRRLNDAWYSQREKDIPTGWKPVTGPDGEFAGLEPAGYRKLGDSLDYAMAQSRWFIMVGECGYGTHASY